MKMAFQCKVRDGYSLTEYVNWISECENKTFHISPEAGVVEIVDNNDKAVKHGVAGEIISTTLFNYAMPMLRYRTGDLAIKSEERCLCGRELPVIEKIIGRIDDYIITPDGKNVGRLDPVFKSTENIVEAQIIQEEKEKINLLIVPASNFSQKDADKIIRNLRSRIGKEMIVSLHKVANIKRNVNGKFKSVICKIK